MGVATGCGCKEVYRFPHTTYPYSSCICSFFTAASLLFVHLKKCFLFFILRIYYPSLPRIEYAIYRGGGGRGGGGDKYTVTPEIFIQLRYHVSMLCLSCYDILSRIKEKLMI